jgi:two-component system chemotaxis response regulator CheY
MPVRVLIVDDSAYARARLNDLFSEHGHEVVGEARSVVEALACYERLHPDVVTIDLLMPDISGFEAASALREADASCRIIMITAAQRHAAMDFIEDMGAPIVHKPVAWPQLKRAIARTLRSS